MLTTKILVIFFSPLCVTYKNVMLLLVNVYRFLFDYLFVTIYFFFCYCIPFFNKLFFFCFSQFYSAVSDRTQWVSLWVCFFFFSLFCRSFNRKWAQVCAFCANTFSMYGAFDGIDDDDDDDVRGAHWREVTLHQLVNRHSLLQTSFEILTVHFVALRVLYSHFSYYRCVGYLCWF